MKMMKVLLQLLALVVGLGFAIALPLFWTRHDFNHLPVIWLVTMFVFLCLIAIMGMFTAQKSPLGILINKENRLSFSRLQMVCWWVMLISAMLVMAGARYTGATATWLNINIPDGLLAAAGLSLGTVAVTSVINDSKRNPSTNQNIKLDEKQEALKAQWVQESVRENGDPSWKIKHLSAQVKAFEERNGFLKVAQAPALTDLFLGNEVGNWEEVDWTKVQALLLTAILIGLYSIALWNMLADPKEWLSSESGSFPAFSGALATLLVISYAGYKGDQLVNHSLVASAASSLRASGRAPDETPGARSLGYVADSGDNIVSFITGKTYPISNENDRQKYTRAQVIFQVPQNGAAVKMETIRVLDGD